MIPSKKQTLDLINEHLTCRLCSGYLIDAWTINECLHSFCRSCIFSYFNDNDENTACPVCSTVPHPANPLLGVTKDCWLQQIVYKLVPSLFKREMCQRRTYYDSNPDSKIKLLEQYSKTLPSQMGCREEELGELSERCLFQQKNKLNNKENIYVTLEYNESDLKDFQAKLHLFFIECSSNMPINILKQYLKKVLPLSKRTRYQIDVLYEQKVLLDSLTLNHIYSWKQSKQPKCKQLHLFYRVIVIEREQNESLIKIEQENDKNLEPVTSSIFNLASSFDDNNPPMKVLPKPAAFIRATTNIYSNPNSFVHTTPFTPAEARTISLNNSITEQFHGNETKELIKAKECTLLDCKTFAITTPINYSMNSISDISKSKKRPKKSNSNDQSLTKKPKPERKKKIKVEKTIRPLLPSNTTMIPLNSSPSENENPNEIVEQKQLSYSEVIQEANKLLAADEPSTPTNNSSSSSISLTNPVTSRLTKPIATVSPLHTSKTNQNKSDDDQLIDLSKSNVTLADVPLKLDCQTEGTKKRSRRTSSSTTRTKISRHSNKSTSDEGNDVSKSLKKTHSNMNSNQFLPPPPPPPATQQQMFQNLFHSFQNQANYWPMTPWPVPPSLALMADPRNYYSQPWPHQSSVAHAPKDLSSASLNDFIGETSNPNFNLPPASALLNSASNFSRTSSSSSLHLHHATNRHRPTTLNGTLS